MTKAPVKLQDLRRRLYIKAKTEPTWRFWGLYVHVCKRETLCEAYRQAKANDGAPGIDGVTFAAVEAEGVEDFLDQLRKELVERTYRPQKARKVEIPKGGGKMRQLSIPSIRDRVVQGALKLILEPIFEADFQPGSFGYRPKKSAHAAIQRVSKAILEGKTYVIDFDLRSYFDTVRHHIVLEKVARRVDDEKVLWLLKLMLDATGKQGVPQGGVMTPRTQKVTWGRRGSGSGTGVRSGRPGVAGLRYGNGMAQRDRLSVDENLLHQESKDLLALSHIQCIGAPP
jgi:RNA-directed DNA polymerase